MVDLRKIALALPGVEPGFAAGAGDRVTLPPDPEGKGQDSAGRAEVALGP